MKTKFIIILCAISLILGAVTGFFVGRGQQVIKETVKYAKGEIIHDTVSFPYPVKETFTTITQTLIPGKIEYRHDTIFKVDTPAIVRDYMIKREYSQKFFDSKEKGRLVVSSAVQYNKQAALYVDYTPVVKEVVKTVKPIFTPFISGGYNSFNQVSAGGGLFYHNAGIEASYIYDLNLKQSGYGGKLVIKF